MPEHKISSIILPGSKSISNRLLLIQAIGHLKFDIHNLSDSDDTQLLIQAIAQINSGNSEINIHHAGTNMRFLCALLSACENKSYTLTGSERMKERPIGELVDALKTLGADIQYTEKEGYPPLSIHGKKLTCNEIEINASVSSQFISALLMIAPCFEKGLSLKLIGNVVSPSYIQLTIELMKLFGVNVEWKANTLQVPAGEYKFNSSHIYNESDWSAAGYFYSAMSIGTIPETELLGLTEKSLQPDSILSMLYSKLGVHTAFSENKVVLLKTQATAQYFEYDFTDCPDIAQTIAVTCFALGIKAKFTGLQTLKIKETDRIIALKNELEKLGAVIESTSHSFEIKYIHPIDKDSRVSIKTYNDHRMAMSFAPLLLLFPNLEIEHKEVVSKSFPAFWDEFSKLYPNNS